MPEYNIAIGEVVSIADTDFIVLDITEESVLCLTKNFAFEGSSRFDANINNYAKSEIRDKLKNIFFKKLADKIGNDNFVEMEINLLTDDGLDEYGKISECFGLLTCDMYRKYNRIIERYPVQNWWWLATAYSTSHRGYPRCVRCVNSGGSLRYYDCDYCNGVRPFVNFKSSFFNL